VHPPGKPEKTRLAELDAVQLPVLVVQGERDPFGMPPDGPKRTVVRVSGDHSLKADLAAVAAAVRDWLPAVV
jgi:predicted alpha/beta-hydrolase family hydrolase